MSRLSNLKDRLKNRLFPKRTLSRQDKIRYYAFFGILVFGGLMMPAKITVSLSPSLDHRVFYLDRSPSLGEIAKGAYVLFDLKHKYINDGKSPATIIKRVACDEGETLLVVDRDYYCTASSDQQAIQNTKNFLEAAARGEAGPITQYPGGLLTPEYLGKAKTVGRKGQKLDPFVYNGEIPKGFAFVGGTHKDSFDSRYYGLIAKNQVKAVASPIW